MAATPEEALHMQIEAIDGTGNQPIRETIHLPFQVTGIIGKTGTAPSTQWNTEEDVPETAFGPNYPWKDTTVKLHHFETVLASELKIAYKVTASRYDEDGEKLTDFDGLFTFLCVDGDWRCINRSPFNIEFYY